MNSVQARRGGSRTETASAGIVDIRSVKTTENGGSAGKMESSERKRRIARTRALRRPAPIPLLEEPVSGLDDASAAAFGEIVAARRGHVTILMAPHRPSHIRIADRVLNLRDGQVEVSVPRLATGKTPLVRVPVFSLNEACP